MPNDQGTSSSDCAVIAYEPHIKARALGHDLTRTGILPQLRISPAQMHGMIAEVAYYRALRRGFASGHELEDWLAAEQEVMANLL